MYFDVIDGFDEKSGKVLITAWETDLEDDEGKVVATVDARTRKVEYLEKSARKDSFARGVIEDVLGNIRRGVYDKYLAVVTDYPNEDVKGEEPTR